MNIKLELSVEQLNIILEGLGELPHKKSHQLIAHIVKTAGEQMKPPEPDAT